MSIFLKKKKADPKERLESILGGYTLPSFPAVVMEVLDELRKPDASAAVLAEKISPDPGLSVGILQLANSAAFAPRQPVENLPQAIMMIGLSKLETVILPFAMRDVASRTSHPLLDIGQFWNTAARRATLAKALGHLWSPGHEEECFLAAYLQNLAVPFLFDAYPSEYVDICDVSDEDDSKTLSDVEREHFGWDHAEVAMWMLNQWGLADSLAMAVGGHHGGLETPDACPEAVRVSRLISGVDSAHDREAVAEALSGHPHPPADIDAFLDTYEAQAAEIVRIFS